MVKKNTRVLAVLAVSLLLIGCSSGTPSDPENTVSDQSEQSVETDSFKISSVLSVPFSSTVQQFPSTLKDYRILEDNIRGKIRLFSDDPFVVDFPELRDFTGFSAGANACSAYYWMIRWRSQNENVEVAVGTSAISDSEDGINWDEGSPSVGGAGFMRGFSCTTPYMYFERAINGNQSTLVDVNYEVLIWEYYQDI